MLQEGMMERGMLSKRFICEHHLVPGLDKEMIRNVHRAKNQEVRVLHSFASLEEKRLYSVVESHDSLTVESFFRELRIPWNNITEIELQCEGRGEVQDVHKLLKAA